MQRLVDINAIDRNITACHCSSDRIESLLAALADFLLPDMEEHLSLAKESGIVLAVPIQWKLANAAVLLDMARSEIKTLHGHVDVIESGVLESAPAVSSAA
jgi:hypothetical protein